MRKFLMELWRDESGISSVEYALLLAVVATGIILAAESLGDAVQTEMQDAADCITGTLPTDDVKCGAELDLDPDPDP